MQNVSTFLNIETIFITLSVNPTLKRRFLIQKKSGAFKCWNCRKIDSFAGAFRLYFCALNVQNSAYFLTKYISTERNDFPKASSSDVGGVTRASNDF